MKGYEILDTTCEVLNDRYQEKCGVFQDFFAFFSNEGNIEHCFNEDDSTFHFKSLFDLSQTILKENYINKKELFDNLQFEIWSTFSDEDIFEIVKYGFGCGFYVNVFWLDNGNPICLERVDGREAHERADEILNLFSYEEYKFLHTEIEKKINDYCFGIDSVFKKIVNGFKEFGLDVDEEYPENKLNEFMVFLGEG